MCAYECGVSIEVGLVEGIGFGIEHNRYKHTNKKACYKGREMTEQRIIGMTKQHTTEEAVR